MNTTQQTDYQRGYQTALDDIADALDRNGDTAAWEWIHANAQSRRTQHIVSHMISSAAMTREEAMKIIEAEYGEFLYAYSPEETTSDTRYVFERKTLFNRELIKTAKELTRA